MPEEKRKINAWIPVSLYNKLENARYENVTQALIKAIEKLTEDHIEDTKGYTEDLERIQAGYKQDIEGYLQDIAGYKQDIAALTTENDKLKEDLSGYHRIHEGYKKDLEKQNQDIIGYKQDITRLNEELDKRPDPVTFAKLQARYEGLQMIIEEKDRRIEALNNDLRKADIDKEDLKATYNNYFLQVQLLINQKAIGTGSTQKEERQKESRPAPKESGYIEKEERLYDMNLEDSPAIKEKPENKPIINQEKNTKEITCLNCGKVFTAARSTRMYCSNACKEAYRRKLKKEV